MPKATSSVLKGKRRKKTPEEIRQYQLQWYHRNKQRLKESATEEQKEAKRKRDRAYYAANKEKICEYQRQHRLAHSDAQVAKKREYRNRDPERWRAYYKEYAAHRSEKRKAYSRDYYSKNSQRIKEHVRQYAKLNAEKVREKARSYKKLNAEKIRAYKRDWTRNREASDHLYRLLRRVGCRINHAIRSAKSRKATRTIALVGCSPAELASHIEKSFRRGMGWRNRSEWHIDHVVPLAAFDLTDERQQRVAFHYTNLQPLWRHENLKKGARLPDGTSARGSRYRTAR